MGLPAYTMTERPPTFPESDGVSFWIIAIGSWGQRAAKLDVVTLFGCRRTRPLEHMASAGLLWAVNGGWLVQLIRDWAVIERLGERSRHIHHRRAAPAANVALPWVGLHTRTDRQKRSQ